MIDGKEVISVKKKCELLEINRTGHYYKPRVPDPAMAAFAERVMARIDYWHTREPAMGSRKLSKIIREQDNLAAGRKLITKMMRIMGIIASYPKPNLSIGNKEHKKRPYLLRGKNIFMPNQVWAIDITYVKMGRTHMYLTVIIDWFSRYIVGWRLSDTLETAPVLEAIKEAIERYGVPAVINSDQGSQFTSGEYTALMKKYGIRQSMDGKARWVDNVIIERWFRSLKCERIYVFGYNTPRELRMGIRSYVEFYNDIRPHESLDNDAPIKWYSLTYSAAVTTA
jgi:putative transposase